MPQADGSGGVFVVEDEQLLRWGLVTQLRRAGFEVEGCESAEDALQRMEEKPARVVLLDIRLPGMDGMECLRILREKYPGTAVVMMTGHGAIESAVEAMRLGAYNYLTKPFDSRSVLSMADAILGAAESVPAPAPETARERTRTTVEPEAPPGPPAGYRIDNLIGSSPAMEQMRRLVLKVARSSANTVLLTGESGTGKDLAAQIIHYSSRRASKPFVHVNVAAVPSALFESELFGHERGSFTDAHAQKQGLLELAGGGTIYLDEIGELTREVQTKLLHFLEHRSFRRVGGVDPLQVDIRVVAATNVDLRARIAAQEFREDLYFRLRVIPIHMPSLEGREDDVLELAEHFLARFNRRLGKHFVGFDAEARRKLRSHRWTGNVRELRNVIERAVTLEDGTRVESSMLVFDEGPRAADTPESAGSGELVAGTGGLKEVEKRMLISALDRTNWNQVRAAEILGIGRDALRYRMRKHGLL
jgi:DNA-binding NtrC family response regulator